MKRRSLAVVAVALLPLAGCSGLYDTPLPGGADLGSHPYHVTVQFTDVVDLVPQAGVKVNDVPVGRVESIDLAEDNRTAQVHVAVNGSVDLPANATAQLRQSSLLGEKFVELSAPPEPVAGKLGEGSVIPVAKTNRNPEIEEVLGALSLLLNGGDLGQVQTIVGELNSALTGNEPRMRSLLSNVEKVSADLDGQKGNITRAIDALNRLTTTLTGQQGNIRTALDGLGPGIAVLNQQRDQLVTMLQSLDKLSGVAVNTVNASRDDLVADLRALEPTLRKLAETGAALPKAVTYLPTFPMPPGATHTIRGDYFNADLYIDMDLSHEVQNLLGGQMLPLPRTPPDTKPDPPSQAPTDGVPVVPLPQMPPTVSVPGVGGLLSNLLGGR